MKAGVSEIEVYGGSSHYSKPPPSPREVLINVLNKLKK